MEAKEIQEKLSAYKLWTSLEEVLDVAIEDGGCPPDSSLYQAFSRNSSPRDKLIVYIANQLVDAHEEKVKKALEAATA